MPAGVVDDERVRRAMMSELPRGQRGALIARAGLVDIDMDAHACLHRQIDRRGRCSVVDRRQPTGVTMRENVDRFTRLLVHCHTAKNLEAVGADRAIDIDIFVGDSLGLRISGGGPRLRRERG